MAPTTPGDLKPIAGSLLDLPQGVYDGANRYDDDNQRVLHLWKDGQSFDVAELKVEAERPDVWAAKQALAYPSRYYGDGGTIHASGLLNVETDSKGNVVAVWFRCQMLPFAQHRVNSDRATEMRGADDLPALTGVEVLDKPRR